MRRAQRSIEGQRYGKLYKTRRWKALRAYQLSAEPFCVMCKREGIITPATVCDHVVPHRGDEALFWGGTLQSLCKPCHDGRKQREERLGYSDEVGEDGWPLDPRHSANRAGNAEGTG